MILGDGLVAGVFGQRVNRFLAVIDIDGRETEVHIANSGRMRELFRPGAPVWVKSAPGPHRKTQFDLALVAADGVLVSADTRLPNALVAEALAAGKLEALAGYTEIRRESTFGDSRLDLRLSRPDAASLPARENPPTNEYRPTTEFPSINESPSTYGCPSINESPPAYGCPSISESPPDNEYSPANKRPPANECLVEVKSVTLVVDGVGLFPDSPTERGVKHLQTLMQAVADGYRAAVVFIVQRPDASAFAANDPADPPLAAALRQAMAAGVEAYAYACRVTHREVTLAHRLPIVPYYQAFPDGAEAPANGRRE